MLGRIFNRKSQSTNAVGCLFDSNTFYPAFEKDLQQCISEVIIESPFMTLRRISFLLPAIQKAVDRGVSIIINTKPLREHDNYMYEEVVQCIAELQSLGVEVLYTGGHHRKLAIFDRKILWEGSLNILSQNDSCEIMRRTESRENTQQMIDFIDLQHFLG